MGPLRRLFLPHEGAQADDLALLHVRSELDQQSGIGGKDVPVHRAEGVD